MKIAIVVHGRFHAFDLARALLKREHEVTLLTNYPRWGVERFGFPGSRTRSFWLHGILSRVADRLRRRVGGLYPEAALHRGFGSWAADQLRRERWDLIHCWSGVSEEIFERARGASPFFLLMRGSSHIRVQAKLLEEEEKRVGMPLDRPSDWMIEREEKEYALADGIRVLSSFAHQSFLSSGVAADKVALIPSAVPLENFRPSRGVIETRCSRLLSGKPLRVLYVGALSFRKGLQDLAQIAGLQGKGFEFRWVGPKTTEAKAFLRKWKQSEIWLPQKPQQQLPEIYAWGDLFLFPTIEDGYPQVLAQAYAGGLPILTTTNCSGPDLIRDGTTGWILPIRSPEQFCQRLLWCLDHRQELVAMIRRITEEDHPRNWSDVARELEALGRQKLKKA